MSKRDTFVCRFAVGDPNGRRSSVWRVWAGRHQPDLYLAARSVAGIVKVSLHASGDRHAGLTAQHVAKLRAQNAWHEKSRHFQRWSSGIAIGQECTFEFQVCFPTEHLRPFGLTDPSNQQVVWVPAAAEGNMIAVNILFGPKIGTHGWPGRKQGSVLLSEGRLIDQTRVWVVGRNLPMAMFHNEDRARKHMTKIATDLERQRMQVTETHRVVAMFRDDLGVHGFVELAGDALTPREPGVAQ